MPQEQHTQFYLKDGTVIHTLHQLNFLLYDMSEEVFSHHVTKEKNDFAEWIKDTLGNEALAKEVWESEGKQEMNAVLANYLVEHLPWYETLRIKWRMAKKKKELAKKHISKKKKAETILADEETVLEETFAKEEEQKEPKKEKELQIHKDPIFLKIGIPGFDTLITKGIPEGSSVLLCGGPGSGKTTFSLHALAALAQQGKKCLYLSFEESEARLVHHMKSYGFNPEQLLQQEQIVITKLNGFDISRSVEALLAKASGELLIELDEVEGIIPEGFEPDVIVLDSLSAVSAAFTGQDAGYRAYIEQLFNLFEKKGLTSFLITEIEQSTSKYSKSGVEEFLADAVIAFYNIRQKSVRTSALEIIKIRGSPHMKKLVPFKMESGQGITVYPQEEVFFE